MKCKDCKYSSKLIDGLYLCETGGKRLGMMINPDRDVECFNENMYKAHTYDDVLNAIDFLKTQILSDLKELDGDITSEFAKMLLAGHRNINVAIRVLEKELANIMLAYTE